MAKAHTSGGLYRNAGGRGFHDADGEPVDLNDVPPELLTEAELAEIAAGGGVADEEEEDQIAGSIEPGDEGGTSAAGGDERVLPEDFPGRAELVAAGLDTVEKVRACPDLSQVHGLGPKRLKQIAEALR